MFSAGTAFRYKGRRGRGFRGPEGKPFHPPLTDLPVAAYTFAALFDIVAFIGRARSWADDLHTAAGVVLIAGIVAAVPTALTGLADRSATSRGSEIRRMANLHGAIMGLATLLAAGDAIYRFTEATTPSLELVLGGVALLMLVSTGGMIGGSMVYDHGFNVVDAASPIDLRDAERRTVDVR